MPNYYVDASQPNDLGAGTSQGTAKQHLRPVLFFLNRSLDQNVWIRGGRYYDVDAVGNGLPSVQASHVRFMPYFLTGDSGNPVLDGRNWIAPGSNRFTLVGPADNGGFVWSLQIGTTSTTARVFAGAVNNGVLLGQRTMGEALRHVPDQGASAVGDNIAQITAALSETDQWYAAGSALQYRIYVWTKTQTDPADYWGGLATIQSGTGTLGFDYGFNILRAQDIGVTNIDVIGARVQAFRVGGTDTDTVPSTSIVIENCNAMCCFSAGFLVEQTTTSTGITNGLTVVSDVMIRNCTANTNTCPREQEPDSTKYGRLSGASDLFYVRNRVRDVRVEGCTSINGFHCGATVGAFDANQSVPSRSGFRRHLATADDWTTYCRGYSTFPVDDTCFLDRCVSNNMNVVSQFSGSPLIDSCVWINNRASVRKPTPDNSGHIAISSYHADGGNTSIGTNRYVFNQPVNIRFYNCSFGPTIAKGPSLGIPVSFYAYATNLGGLPFPTFPDGAITFQNCVFVDTDGTRTATSPFLYTYQETGVSVGTQVFDTSCVYRKGTTDAVVQYNSSGTITTSTVSAAAGFTNIMRADPLVDKALRPKYGSPLIGAAADTPKFARRDVTGRQRRSTFSIGAYEAFVSYNRSTRT